MSSLEEFRHIERLINEEKEAFFDEISKDEEEKVRLSVLLYDAGRLSFHHKGLHRHGLRDYSKKRDCSEKLIDGVDIEDQSKYLKVIFRHLRYIAREGTNLRKSYKERAFFRGGREKGDEINHKKNLTSIRNLICKYSDIICSELAASPERWIGDSDKFSVHNDQVEFDEIEEILTSIEGHKTDRNIEKEIQELFERLEIYLDAYPGREDEAYAYPVQYAGQYQGFTYIIVPKILWKYSGSKAYNYLDKISSRIAPKIFQAKVYNFEKNILEEEGRKDKLDWGSISAARAFFDHVERVFNVVGGIMRIRDDSRPTYFLKRIGRNDGVAPYKLKTCSVDSIYSEFRRAFEDNKNNEGIQFEDVMTGNPESIDAEIRDEIHPLESQSLEELITPSSKILFNHRFDGQIEAEFCLYFYEKREDLIQESHQINATLSRMIATVERAENLHRATRKAEEKARRNAVSTVMLRNFAHNIGSHVAANATNKKVKERIKDLYC
jgi:hypothetical protein